MNTQRSFKSAVLDRVSEELDPEGVCDLEQQKKLIREVLEVLDPHHRWMIEQKYFKNLSNRDIAETLGKPPGSLGVTFYNLRQKLKAALIEANTAKAKSTI